MLSSQVIPILGNVSIEVRVHFRPPGDFLMSELENYLVPTTILTFQVPVGLALTGGIAYSSHRCSISFHHSTRTTEKRILREIGATRAVLRTKATKAAMNALLTKVGEAQEKAVKAYDTGKLFTKASTLAVRRQKARRRADLERAKRILREAFIVAGDLSLDEVIMIWHECQVQLVTET